MAFCFVPLCGLYFTGANKAAERHLYRCLVYLSLKITSSYSPGGSSLWIRECNIYSIYLYAPACGVYMHVLIHHCDRELSQETVRIGWCGSRKHDASYVFVCYAVLKDL